MVLGLSPRVRGNPRTAFRTGGRCGSIPARAGEPRRPPRDTGPGEVYPRACGGTGSPPPLPFPLIGLSPRVRGNQPAGLSEADGAGSIPARAGEPGSSAVYTNTGWVYPRACGGTREQHQVPSGHEGLSPRVRGNRVTTLPSSMSNGSIPARAGEPHRSAGPRGRGGVYPRACGGTTGARS